MADASTLTVWMYSRQCAMSSFPWSGVGCSRIGSVVCNPFDFLLMMDPAFHRNMISLSPFSVDLHNPVRMRHASPACAYGSFLALLGKTARASCSKKVG